jgi:uncharacterized protein (DUF302 family)
MKKGMTLAVGLCLGAGVLAVAGALLAPKAMLKEQLSPYNHPETVAQIQHAVTNGEWIISHTMDMQKSLAKHGKVVGRVTVLKICEPNHAEKILQDDDAMYVSVMMPCSIAIYDKSDGKTYVSTMNAGLMGRMFGGTVAKVMAGAVASETAAFTDFLDAE